MFAAAAGQARPSRARARDPRALGARGHVRAAARAEPRRPEVVSFVDGPVTANKSARASTPPGAGRSRTSSSATRRCAASTSATRTGSTARGSGSRSASSASSASTRSARSRSTASTSSRAAAARSSSSRRRDADARLEAARPVDGLGQRLLHVQRHEHRVHLAVPEERARARLALHRPPLDRVVPALRDVALAARALAVGRLPGPRRPVALRPLPAARPAGRVARRSGRRRRGRCRRTSPPPSSPDAEYGRRENGEWVAVARYPDETFVEREARRGARRLALPRAVRRARPGRRRSSTA